MNGAQLRKSAFNTPVSVVNSDKKRQIILLFSKPGKRYSSYNGADGRAGYRHQNLYFDFRSWNIYSFDGK